MVPHVEHLKVLHGPILDKTEKRLRETITLSCWFENALAYFRDRRVQFNKTVLVSLNK
jgi:hypothetical protein